MLAVFRSASKTAKPTRVLPAPGTEKLAPCRRESNLARSRRWKSVKGPIQLSPSVSSTVAKRLDGELSCPEDRDRATASASRTESDTRADKDAAHVTSECFQWPRARRLVISSSKSTSTRVGAI
jgi:hypothetical protein